MAPRKNQQNEGKMEIKQSLIVMSVEISKVVKQQSKLLGHNGESARAETGNQGEGQTNE